MIIRKGKSELERMRNANLVVARVLERVRSLVRPGVSTQELDEVAETMIREAGAEPAFKGYRGYPATVCASVNNEIVHGIPSPEKVLREGDILAVDVGARWEGFYGDAAWTFPVGQISDSLQQLLDVTRDALYVGIGRRVPAIAFRIFRRRFSATSKRMASRWSGTSLGTGSGGHCTRIRRCRILASRAAALAWSRGWCWPSSRW